MTANFRILDDTLYVGNLSFSTTEDDLHSLFATNGHEVAQAAVITNYKSGRSRGFGFVRLQSIDAAESAMSLDGTELDGRKISISKGREKSLRRPTGKRP